MTIDRVIMKITGSVIIHLDAGAVIESDDLNQPFDRDAEIT